MNYVIGLDLGTSTIKGTSVDSSGTILTSVKTRVKFISGLSAGTHEIEPDYYISLIFKLLKDLLHDNREPAAISWVAASGNLMLLNQYDHPITPIFSWMDKRPLHEKALRYPNSTSSQRIYQILGWPFDPKFPLGRLLWLNTVNPKLIKCASRLCMQNDYLGFALTRKWKLDYSTATTFQLFNQVKKTPSPELAALAGIQGKKLSTLSPTGSLLGKLTPQACDRLDLSPKGNIDVILGCFDHPGAARAVNLCTSEQLLMSCGTSWVGCILLPDREYGIKKQLLIDPYTSDTRGGSWMGMFSQSGIGAIFNTWVNVFIKTFSPETTVHASVIDALSASCGEKPVPVIDICGSETPHMAFCRLSNGFSMEQIAVAMLESVVFSFKYRAKEKSISFQPFKEILLVGGPSESSQWPQIIADVLELPVIVRYGQIAGSFGAAMIAASYLGWNCSRDYKTSEFSPNLNRFPSLRKRYAEYVSLRLSN